MINNQTFLDCFFIIVCMSHYQIPVRDFLIRRVISSSSGTSRSSMIDTSWPRTFSISFKASACAIVRGNPSKITPLLSLKLYSHQKTDLKQITVHTVYREERNDVIQDTEPLQNKSYRFSVKHIQKCQRDHRSE